MRRGCRGKYTKIHRMCCIELCASVLSVYYVCIRVHQKAKHTLSHTHTQTRPPHCSITRAQQCAFTFRLTYIYFHSRSWFWLRSHSNRPNVSIKMNMLRRSFWSARHTHLSKINCRLFNK